MSRFQIPQDIAFTLNDQQRAQIGEQLRTRSLVQRLREMLQRQDMANVQQPDGTLGPRDAAPRYWGPIEQGGEQTSTATSGAAPTDEQPNPTGSTMPTTASGAADMLRQNAVAGNRGQQTLSRAQRDAIMRQRRILHNDELRKKREQMQRARMTQTVNRMNKSPEQRQIEQRQKMENRNGIPGIDAV